MAIGSGMPSESGGNNPAVAAALSRMQGRGTGQGAPAPGMDQGQGQGVGFHLAQALEMFIQGGANPADTQEVKLFFESFVKLAQESESRMGDQAPMGPGPGPGMAAQAAAAAPQPDAMPPIMPR